MLIRLQPIDETNKHHVNQIRAGANEIALLHYNAYWVGQAALVEDIWAYLIYDERDQVVGFVALGACYEDEYLSLNKLETVGEIYHLVIDPVRQDSGVGKSTMNACSKLLANKGFTSIRVAHAPSNFRASKFYTGLGFRPIGANYDSDPYLECHISQVPTQNRNDMNVN